MVSARHRPLPAVYVPFRAAIDSFIGQYPQVSASSQQHLSCLFDWYNPERDLGRTYMSNYKLGHGTCLLSSEVFIKQSYREISRPGL
jgi:hypothetical protein